MVKITQVLYEIGEKINIIISKLEDVIGRVGILISEVWGRSSPIGESRISLNERKIGELEVDYNEHKRKGGKWFPSGAHYARAIETDQSSPPSYIKILPITDAQSLYEEFLKHVATRRVPALDTVIPPGSEAYYYGNTSSSSGIKYSHFSGAIQHKYGSLEEYLEGYVERHLLKEKSILKWHFQERQIIFPYFVNTNWVSFQSGEVQKIWEFPLMISSLCSYLSVRTLVGRSTGTQNPVLSIEFKITPCYHSNSPYSYVITRNFIIPQEVANYNFAEYGFDIPLDTLPPRIKEKIFSNLLWATLKISVQLNGISGVSVLPAIVGTNFQFSFSLPSIGET